MTLGGQLSVTCWAKRLVPWLQALVRYLNQWGKHGNSILGWAIPTRALETRFGSEEMGLKLQP